MHPIEPSRNADRRNKGAVLEEKHDRIRAETVTAFHAVKSFAGDPTMTSEEKDGNMGWSPVLG
jgi:hypothetical protein